MPSLFGSTGNLFSQRQLGSLSSLTSLSQPASFDAGMASTLIDPTQPQFGGISKLAGSSLAPGETDPLTGSFGSTTAKMKGSDLASLGPAGNIAGLTGGYSTGSATSLGGDWAKVDRWDNQINAAANKYGVPANLLKAIMRLESGGEMLGRNGAGAIGLMQVVDTYWGGLGYDLYDPAQNIMAGAHVLKQFYDQYAGWAQANGVDPWQAAVYSYYAGNPYNLNARDRVDQGGSGITTGDYGSRIWQDFQRLNMLGGGMNQPGIGYNPGGFGDTGQAIQAMFGGNAGVPDWGEFGVESTNGFYGYGTQYGLNGTQHTGVDVPLPVGSRFFAPMGGTVRCSGTGIGTDAGGGGCGSFGDEFGNGAGRVEIELDNGVVLIFGHSSQAFVRPGQRVNAGDLLGASGGMVSAHIHLEARVRDPSTPSGWRIVDPRQVLGSSFVAPSGGSRYTTGYSQPAGRSYDPRSLLQRLRG